MSNKKAAEFGFYPEPLDVRVGDIEITTLPGLKDTVTDIMTSSEQENGWWYEPISGRRSWRVFALPKTHSICHAKCDDEGHLDFLIWVLSFLVGMRLTTESAGFLDATPTKPGTLVDFVLLGAPLERGLALADEFWTENKTEPARAQGLVSAVHALFLGQSPRNLEFESFIFLYMALDACFRLASSLHGKPASGSGASHAGRINWMCGLLALTTPAWASPRRSPGQPWTTDLSEPRNEAIHEALFNGAPLGFRAFDQPRRNMTLEMPALLCRLLVALLHHPSKAPSGLPAYVRTPVNTRSDHSLTL